ncbi:MAG: 6-bladed beta-propeller [Gemmatimonadota bacterium]|uniref:6-bladed beta-propeller n=1 Tax=Candidatus Palauibacter scopulicola TaxID=3056741 RepID=UPI0023847A4A|nr:6-bladed beta-propeller [Candidatus Palauibacter scopulicola]MDE2663952.1 6-bladed beta-propeller [Candidatus Palauibacter scopulicola]
MSGKLTASTRNSWFIAFVVCTGILVVCAGVPRPAAAQALLPIADRAGDCTVRLREVLRLGDPGDPGTIGSRPEITRTAAGEYIVASVENRGQLLVFDSDGAFLETLGGNGDGPGEYRVPGRMRPGSDGSLRILDLVNRRITLLSADGGWIETTDIRSLHGLDFAVIDRGERYAVSGFGQVDDVLGATTEIVDRGGVRSASLGATPVESWVVNFFRAPVAVDGEGSVWTTRAGEYGFEAWDPEGGSGPRARLAGDPEWFDPGPPQPGAPVSAPAPSIVISLRFDRGLLWAGTWVADENREASSGAAPSPLELDRLLDTVLDVIDPASGALIARIQRDEALRGTGDDALLFGVREDGGIARAVIFEPALAGPACPSSMSPGM